MPAIAFRLEVKGVCKEFCECSSAAGLAIAIFDLISRHPGRDWISLRYMIDGAMQHPGHQLAIDERSCWSSGQNVSLPHGPSDAVDERCSELFDLVLRSNPILIPDPKPLPF